MAVREPTAGRTSETSPLESGRTHRPGGPGHVAHRRGDSVTASSTDVDAESNWAAQWRDALGAHWRVALYLIAVLLFVAGFSLPFANPDLPIHLATGECIAKH